MAVATETDADRKAIDEANARQDRSIDELAEDPDLDVEPDGQVTIAGTRPTVNATVGGRKPDMAKATIRSMAVPVTGQFDKGEKVRVTIDLTCTKIEFVDEEDSNGKVVRTVRKHTFRPDEILSVVSPD